MLPTSISTRVIAAFGTVVAVVLLLLAAGWMVAGDVRHANQAVRRLSERLRVEDAQDRAQQQLRLAIGEVTRAAEQPRPITPAQWLRVQQALAGFRASYRTPAEASSARDAAASDFARLAGELIADARAEPLRIARDMPQFLAALRVLERERAEARRRLVDRIDAAVARSSRELYVSISRIVFGVLGVLLLLLASFLWLRRQVLRPIVAIADQLRQFGTVDGEVRVEGRDRADEIGDLARGLGEYRDAVEQRRRAEKRIEFLAHHDLLTALPNRLLFEERLAQDLARATRTGQRVAVFAIDLDDFKSVNDRFGHAGGDRALNRAAQLLTGCVRADDMVARLGGDEFAIIQVAPDQPRAAEALLMRIFRACDVTAGDEVPVQMSVGVALSGAEQAREELYNLADMAMYRAKSEGRHTARFFDEALKEETRLRWRLSRDLEGAVERGEMSLVYQPMADARTLRVIGYEALLRWRHPELGDVRPDQFIPLAESSGRIDSLGLWVADQAMAAARGWPDHAIVALNLSPVQFRQADLAADLLALAERHGLAPERLEFEVTESATLLGHRRDDVLGALRALQDRGARIVMDDFGTGYSSLGNLRDFRFDKLKVDRSFVSAMLDHAPSASIVRSIAALGESLGVPVAAEGVETEEQLALLRRWGFPQVQGYLLGRPERLETVLRSAAYAGMIG
ncbi:EAL domain-containing protein [Sphingomonas sp. BK069]|uniref:putative bifunctional diguanylate cyclase/phosphodiesterase n=1 Tax=Sphingomonas sp. BK069 TaxID=2586979 RepID=UPI0016177F10|nr:EAL domain-containing protein [Sphingomonas sp. BK069]MBB3349390.1 diguanylate cyclase (GGDEF)-like protein [Sphingomonas sp. BK069]